jgi:hypothetical protein
LRNISPTGIKLLIMIRTLIPTQKLILALALILSLFSSCLGFEETFPATEIPAAPPIAIATATGATVNQIDDGQKEGEQEVQSEGFPVPGETSVPPTPESELDTTVMVTTTVVLPTPTAEPISIPPFQLLNENNLPPTNHDLAYISAGTLMLWTHANRQIKPLFVPEVDRERFPAGTFAEVALVDFSADGNRAAVAVRYDLPPEIGAEGAGDGSGDSDADVEIALGETEFDIFFVDAISKESWILVSGIKTSVSELVISPDQALVTFITESIVANSNEIPDSTLLMVGTPSDRHNTALTQLHECDLYCSLPIWRQDSDLFVFVDNQGILLVDAAEATTEYILRNSPPAEESESPVEQYWPHAWSPNARAILLSSGLGNSHEKVIFDIPTKQLITIPNSYNLQFDHVLNLFWLSDSRLIIANLDNAQARQTLTTFRVDFDGGTSSLDETLTLPFNDQQPIFGFTQLRSGRFAFGILSLNNVPSDAGLHTLTSFSESPKRINGIPVFVGLPNILWSMDGSEAIEGFATQTFLAAADGNLYKFSQRVWGVHWLEPSPVQR